MPTQTLRPRHKPQRHDACGDAGTSIARPAGASVVDMIKQTAPPAPAAPASDAEVVAILVVTEETAPPPTPQQGRTEALKEAA